MTDLQHVLVTGGAGFIGSHTVDALMTRGCRVSVLDNLSTGYRANIKQWDSHARFQFIEGDVTGDVKVLLDKASKRFGPIARIAHFAAQTAVPISVDDPVGDITVNLGGTARILEYARHNKVAKVVFASSSAVYDDDAPVPVSEELRARPASPYGIDKLAAEFYLDYYARLFALNFTALRFMNVYGPRQDPASWYSGVISIFLDRAVTGQAITIFDDGEQTRDFVYVTDVAAVFVDALLSDKGNGAIVNIGTGVEVTINQITRTILDLAGSSSTVRHEPPRPGDIRRSVTTMDKAVSLLAFKPQVELREGLAETLAWVRTQTKTVRSGLRGLIRLPVKLLKLVALLAGLGLFAWILSETDLAAVGGYMSELGGAGVAAIAIVFIIGFSADVGAWLLLFRTIPTTWVWSARLWLAQMIGEAVNVLAPFGSLGGEPVKAMMLKRRYDVSYSESTASLVLALTVNSLAEVPFAIIGVLLLAQDDRISPTLKAAIAGATAVITVFMALVLALLHMRALVAFEQRLARSRWGARLAGALVFLKDIEEHFFHIVRRSPGRFTAAFALSFFVWVAGAIEMYLIFYFLGHPISASDAWLMETAIVLVRSATFFIPGHLGAQDGAIALVAAALTGSPEMGLAVALVRRGRELLWSGFGLLIGAWVGLREPKAA